jgi:hypothetical protein
MTALTLLSILTRPLKQVFVTVLRDGVTRKPNASAGCYGVSLFHYPYTCVRAHMCGCVRAHMRTRNVPVTP